MDQTLGKRIMQHRKRLGLTQDALAERLGVTAQAVSKWENDQSCPDIAMLPKLAEIFGVTTDALLGIAPQQPVHEAEVVEEAGETEESEGLFTQKGGWEFQWEPGKKGGILFAFFVLLVGSLTLLSQLLNWGASFWDILWPSALLIIGVTRLFSKFSFFGIGCTLFGGYFLVENLGIWQLELGGDLVFPIIVVLFGISLLADALGKPRKREFHISKNGVKLDGTEKTKSTFSTDEHSFACSLSFGQNTHVIDLPLLQKGDISCSFGELTVDLSECGELSENCKVIANCSFGQLNLLVPHRFRVEPDSSTAFASINIKGQPDPNPDGILRLDASVSFGEIQIRYI